MKLRTDPSVRSAAPRKTATATLSAADWKAAYRRVMEVLSRVTVENERLRPMQERLIRAEDHYQFLTMRVTQLEAEKRELLNRLLAAQGTPPLPAEVPAVHIVPQPSAFGVPVDQTTPQDMDTILASLSFEDVGDEEAARLKVRHTEGGTVVYDS